MIRNWFLRLAGCLAVLSSVSCGHRDPPNVVMVLVDTLRVDHLSLYGSSRMTTPFLDRLARTGTTFERAYSASSWTLPAAASILTGLYPSAHGARSEQHRIPEEVTTLAEVLGENGYVSAGIVSHVFVGTEYQFQQGFGHFDDGNARGHTYVSTDSVVSQCVEWLETKPAGPFFLFVHLFDPHDTYTRHSEYAFAGDAVGRVEGDETMRELRKLQKSIRPEELALVRDVYDEEIRFTDRGIERIWESVETLGLANNTVFLLTADHGEEFLERGRFGHGRSIHDELVKVPFVAAGPGVASRVSDRPVSTVSMAATVLDLLGIDDSRIPRNPGSVFVPDEEATMPFIETDYDNVTRQRAVVGEQYKLIWDQVNQRSSLYDVLADPGETEDVSARHPEVTERLEEAVQRRMSGIRLMGRAARGTPLPEEILEILRGMGYVD